MVSLLDVDAEPVEPILPLKVSQRIIEVVADMVFASHIRGVGFTPGPRGDCDNHSEQHNPCQEWLQTLLSLSFVSKSFNIISRPYMMRTIKVSSYDDDTVLRSIRHPFLKWFPPSFEKLLEDGGPVPKVLERVNGLIYNHYSSRSDLDFTIEQTTPHPSEPHLLSLPSLQFLTIGVPAGVNPRCVFDYSMETHRNFGFWRLLESYVFGRPKGLLQSSSPESNVTLASFYSGWSQPTVPLRSLTHLSLSYIDDLPLLHILTSGTLTTLQLHYCTAVHETNGVSLFSESSENLSESGSCNIITLVPSTPPPLLGLQAPPKPGFRLRSWKAMGIADVTPSLLRYCVMLEDLDVTLVNSDGISSAHPEAFPVIILSEGSTAQEAVPLPRPAPFQNVRKLRCGGRIDWENLCALAENEGQGVKLFPNLRELTLDREIPEEDDNDAKQVNSDLVGLLIGHVDKLEVLRVIRGHPLAFNLSQALLECSNELKKLYIGWEIENPLHFPPDICESTLCDALDAIRPGVRIETLEVVLDFYDIISGCEFLLGEIEDGHNPMQANNEGGTPLSVNRWTHWTRLSTLLSSNTGIDFPFLKRVCLHITIHTILLGEQSRLTFAVSEDSDIDVARNFQRRFIRLLDLAVNVDAGVSDIGGLDVKLKVTIETDNELGETRTNIFEVTRSAITCSKSIRIDLE